MKRRDQSRHFDLTGCEAELPANFAERLTVIKERSGLTWEAMAEAVGVDSRQLLRWRRGAMPRGGSILALTRFAVRIPGGLSELLGGELIVSDGGES